MEAYDIPCYGDDDVLANYKYLDTLNLSSYFVDKTGDLSEIITIIEENYENQPELPAFLHGNLFNYLCEFEIVGYLCHRYNLVNYTVTKYYYKRV